MVLSNLQFSPICRWFQFIIQNSNLILIETRCSISPSVLFFFLSYIFKLIWRLFKGNLQLTIVTMYSLFYSWQHIFNSTPGFLISLCRLSSEDSVKPFFSKETVCQKHGRSRSRSTGPRRAERGQSSDSGIYSGHCSHVLLWLNPLRAPPKPTPTAKGIQQNPSEMNSCLLAQRSCGLPSLPPVLTFSWIGSLTLIFWLSFLILCSLDGVLLYK